MREVKDSGIAWVGTMPTNWDVKRGKFTLRLLNRPLEETDEVITCFRDGEVTLRRNRREDGFTVSLKEIGYQGIEPGDLVIHGMDGFAGAIGISDSRGKSSPVLVVCDSSENKKYIMYYLRSMAYNDVFTALATGIRVRSCDLRWNKLAELPFILPSPDEQDKIVEAIEINIRKINTLIANVQSQIEKLKAYKQSVITEIVTKGLDPTVPMKDSGVEWIGKIPVHWDVVKTGHLFKENNRKPLGNDTPLSLSQVDGLIATDDMKESSLKTSTYENWKRVEIGDLVLNRFKAHLGVLFAATLTGIVSFHYGVYEARRPLDPKFYEYLYHSDQYRAILGNASNGMVVGLQNLSNLNFYSTYSLYPPYREQEAIVTYLDEKCSQIGRLIAIKQAKIEKLEQYKKSLIYEYVTGKREI